MFRSYFVWLLRRPNTLGTLAPCPPCEMPSIPHRLMVNSLATVLRNQKPAPWFTSTRDNEAQFPPRWHVPAFPPPLRESCAGSEVGDREIETWDFRLAPLPATSFFLSIPQMDDLTSFPASLVGGPQSLPLHSRSRQTALLKFIRVCIHGYSW